MMTTGSKLAHPWIPHTCDTLQVQNALTAVWISAWELAYLSFLVFVFSSAIATFSVPLLRSRRTFTICASTTCPSTPLQLYSYKENLMHALTSRAGTENVAATQQTFMSIGTTTVLAPYAMRPSFFNYRTQWDAMVSLARVLTHDAWAASALRDFEVCIPFFFGFFPL